MRRVARRTPRRSRRHSKRPGGPSFATAKGGVTTTSDRVLMTIVELHAQLALGEDIAVISPSVHHCLFVERSACPAIQRLGPETLPPVPHIAQTLLAAGPDVLFEGLKDVADGDGSVVGAGVRVEEHMDMFRHHHVAYEADAEPRLQRPQRLDDDTFHAVIMEELQPTVAGDRPKVCVRARCNGADAKACANRIRACGKGPEGFVGL